jgi:DNA-binding beta-propeller fold protein YncE
VRTGDSQFDIAHDVALDKQGRVYVADRTNNRIQIFDLNGKFLGKWTDIGQPWGLAYSEKENCLYMADGDNNRVVKLNLDGQVQGVLGGFGKIPGKFDFAHHIAVDSEGSLYVAEIKNWRAEVRQVTRAGAPRVTHRSHDACIVPLMVLIRLFARCPRGHIRLWPSCRRPPNGYEL